VAWFAVFVIAFVAAVAQATTGFGYALVAVPLLTLASDPRTAVVGAALASMLSTTGLTVRERAHVRWRVAGWLLLAAVLGMPVGLAILRYTPDRTLTIVIALSVLACTLLVWRRVRLRTGPFAVGVVGALSGVLSTATGTSGPPLVAAFQSMGYDPRTFRATISAVFTGMGVVGLVGFFATGQLTAAAGLVGLIGLPATALGWWVGDHAFARFDEERFRRVLLGALVVVCGVTLARAVV
jgi:hypothetical protein